MLSIEIQNLISNLGWSLIHFLWQGTLITLAYWVITRNISSIHAKYWTGMGLVVLSLITPFVNTFSQNNALTATATLMKLDTVIISHQQLSIDNLMLYAINQSLPYLVIIWAIVVVFLSFRLIRSWVNLAAIKHDCDPQLSRQLKQYVKKIATKLDLPIIPALKVSQQVLVPAAYGIIKPTVLLPLSLIGQIPREQLEAIIKHELCHLKRNDFIHNIIQLCADTLLFFHPGIRWMNNDIRHVREQCCDQMVLSNDTETLTYAKALTSIAEYTNDLKLKHSIHLGINDGLLLNRVKFLLQDKSSQSSLMIFAPLLLIIVFSFMMLLPDFDHNKEFSESTQSSSSMIFGADEELKQMTKKVQMNALFYPSLKQKEAPKANITNKPESITYKNTAINYQLLAETAKSLKPSQPEQIDFSAQLKTTMTYNNGTETNIASTQEDTNPNSALELAEQSLPIEPTPDADSISNSNAIDTNMASQTRASKELSSFQTTAENSIKPEFKRYVAPTYPQQFWLSQIEQEVIATFKINPSGKAYDIQLNSQQNKYIAFEREVEKAMKNWRFETASLSPSTLQHTYQQIFSFALSEELEKNCSLVRTGSRLAKSVPCNK